jgi:DNA-binding transcriptional MerR regulator
VSEYRINELAELAGVSVRNIRVYQDRGLLPPPEIKGRTGWYAEEHLVRLQLISRMLERGYTFATISELLLAARYGMKVEHVLADPPKPPKLQTLRRAAKITMSELRNNFGDQASDSNIALGQRIGILVKEGAGYAVRRPELLDLAEVLVRAGVPLEVLLRLWERAQQDVEDIAAGFVSLITDRYSVGTEGQLDYDDAQVAELAELIEQVRPRAHEIVENAFAAAMDQQISAALRTAADQFVGTDGQVPPMPVTKPKRKLRKR